MSKIVRVDERGRVSLGSLVEPNTYYIASTDETGTIYLEPALVMTMTELESAFIDNAEGREVNLENFTKVLKDGDER